MSIKQPHLRQLNVKNYEINQIQVYNSEVVRQLNRYVDLQSTKKTIVENSAIISLNINAGQRNDYLIFQMPIYDPFGSYNPGTGIFTAAADAVYRISVNLLLTVGGSGTFGIFGQVNKSNISPQTSQGTNYDTVFSYLTSNGSSPIQLFGTKYLILRTGDQLSMFLYSSLDNPSIGYFTGNQAQVNFTW